MQITYPTHPTPSSPPVSLVLAYPLIDTFPYPMSIIISLCTNVPIYVISLCTNVANVPIFVVRDHDQRYSPGIQKVIEEVVSALVEQLIHLLKHDEDVEIK